jgi:hypothetical protein
MQHRFSSQLVVAVVFAALSLGVLYTFVRIAEPPERKPSQLFTQDYSEQSLDARLTPARLRQRIDEIRSASIPINTRQMGRLCGSPGFYNTERLILETFRRAGLEILTQEFTVVVPVTEYCEMLDENGRPVPGVELFPFEPSAMFPTVLPPGGLTGKVVCTESAAPPPEGFTARVVNTESSAPLDLVGKRLEGSIVINNGMDVAWPALAALGVRAVIVREDAMDLTGDPDVPYRWGNLVSYANTPFPRFFARGPVEQCANRQITLRCKVTWQSKKVRNLIGILKSPSPAREALVINSYYDSYSAVPDLAPGAEQSLSLATMLDCVEAMASYRGRFRRDVVFVAAAGHSQGLEGASRILQAVEPLRKDPRIRPDLETQAAEHRGRLDDVRRALEIVENEEPWDPSTGPAFYERWTRMNSPFRTWFEKCFSTVAGEVAIEKREQYLAKRVAWIKGGRPNFHDGFNPATVTAAERAAPESRHPLMRAYLETKKQDSRAGSLVSTPFWLAAKHLQSSATAGADDFKAWDYRGKTRRYFEELGRWHAQQTREIDDAIRVRELFRPYENTLTINLELFSGGQKKLRDLAVLVGVKNPGTLVEPQSTDLRDLIAEKIPQTQGNPVLEVKSWRTHDAQGDPGDPCIYLSSRIELESAAWFRCGRLAFTIANKSFYPARVGTPQDTFEDLSSDILAQQLPVVGRGLLSVACGRVAFKEIPTSPPGHLFTCHGSVFASVGDSSIIPSHPMGRNTFVKISEPDHGPVFCETPRRGCAVFPVVQADPYGGYHRPLAFNLNLWGWTVLVNAMRFDDQGQILYGKDASAAIQGIFKNEAIPPANLEFGHAKSIHVALFRCAPVYCYQRGNPQTLNAFAGFDFLDRSSLQPPSKIWIEKSTYNPGMVALLEPDCTFCIALTDGSPQNPATLAPRAFMLNVDPDEPVSDREPELYGRGYLVAETHNITFPWFDSAASVLRTNEKRLRLQERFHMADRQMLALQTQGWQWLKIATDLRRNGNAIEAVNAAGRSLSCAINNHPVIREKISYAVFGILWYLGLLVPFAFFFEKLLFGFTDIRKQLTADGILFVIVFALLYVFHPAFQMVSSPMMILFGFLILLLSLVVTLMITSRFQQTIRVLRRKEGHVEGADINRGGVIGTAFLLGLNNMRRRKVRTGLTCLTLVLITFVMICFTSVSSTVVEEEYTTGRSPANGLFRIDRNFMALSDNEVNNFQQLYGLKYPVTTHKWLTHDIWPSELKNTQIFIDREIQSGGQKFAKRAVVNAAIVMTHHEPLFSSIDRCLLTSKGWFPPPPETPEQARRVEKDRETLNYLILPDTVATALGISIDNVNRGRPKVDVRGEEFEVHGIIDSVKLTSLTGMDGRPLLPYDINSVGTLGTRGEVWSFVVPENAGRLKGSQVLIASRDFQPQANERFFTVSCAVLFPKAPYHLRPDLPESPTVDYKTQRLLVAEYLERVGTGAYYAIDGISYYGSRLRARTLTGLIELLIPILIAAVTVFNTMRGSVYERSSEIYVYNAVGIAPNHIFFMFMAEACVYAVIGAMLGYLLSQISGTLLTAAGLTGGLNMDYSSIETIYASLAIVGAVLVSTIIPARTAARLALPSDEVNWTIPQAQGDVMRFNLPFTFNAHDRLAVISYFRRWLDANGEGSSGSFFCSPPSLRMDKEKKSSTQNELVPGIEATVWLKPFDLAVSQRLRITLPTDSETDEFIASITLERLSGTTTAWNRTVMPFLGVLRKQFLNWRAVSDAERSEMFAEARELYLKKKEDAHA